MLAIQSLGVGKKQPGIFPGLMNVNLMNPINAFFL